MRSTSSTRTARRRSPSARNARLSHTRRVTRPSSSPGRRSSSTRRASRRTARCRCRASMSGATRRRRCEGVHRMRSLTFRLAAGAAFLAAVGVTAVSAQQPQTVRIRGAIEKVDGDTVVVKAIDGADVTLTLTANAQIVGVAKASLADIKAGSFVGSAAMPQPDGSQKALEVHIFAESQRGTGEGHRPWDGAPNSTMTNGTAGATVIAADGPTITVKYRDGEKKIVVPPGIPIVRYEIGSRDDLKVGASITVPAATKKPDGTFETARVNVG